MSQLCCKPKYNPAWTVAEYAYQSPPDGWEEFFQSERVMSCIKSASDQLDYATEIGLQYYPIKRNIFRAFELVRPEDVRVVILGQDPYPGDYNGVPYANGLSFSVDRNIPLHKIPGSLKNVFKELKSNYPDVVLNNGDLTSWALQGILFLNTCLTVTPGKPGSHKDIWGGFINNLFHYLRDRKQEIIYVLWGQKAQDAAPTTDVGASNPRLISPHPSPQTAGAFQGNQHFLKINSHFARNQKPIISFNTY